MKKKHLQSTHSKLEKMTGANRKNGLLVPMEVENAKLFWQDFHRIRTNSK